MWKSSKFDNFCTTLFIAIRSMFKQKPFFLVFNFMSPFIYVNLSTVDTRLQRLASLQILQRLQLGQ